MALVQQQQVNLVDHAKSMIEHVILFDVFQYRAIYAVSFNLSHSFV